MFLLHGFQDGPGAVFWIAVNEMPVLPDGGKIPPAVVKIPAQGKDAQGGLIVVYIHFHVDELIRLESFVPANPLFDLLFKRFFFSRVSFFGDLRMGIGKMAAEAVFQIRLCAEIVGGHFSVYLEEGQTLTVAATEVTTHNDTRMLEIFGPDESRLTGHVSHQDPIENPITETWTATETGTHYFWVYWTGDPVVYDLSVDVAGP